MCAGHVSINLSSVQIQASPAMTTMVDKQCKSSHICPYLTPVMLLHSATGVSSLACSCRQA